MNCKNCCEWFDGRELLNPFCSYSCVEESQKIIERKPKQRKLDAHVQLSKRYTKALEVKNLVKFTQVGTSFVPSKKEMPETGHYPHFGRKQFCECTSQTIGYSQDPNFCCYHILASRIFWEETTSKETREKLNLY